MSNFIMVAAVSKSVPARGHSAREVEPGTFPSNPTKLSPDPAKDVRKTGLSSTLVLRPTYITQDFDSLRFEAGAYGQLLIPEWQAPTTITPSDLDSDTEQVGSTAQTPPKYSTLLVSSPYNFVGHYLDLSTLSTTSLLFAKALTALKPTRPDYATAPYTESLNFPHVLEVLQDLCSSQDFFWRETSFYVVVFRSKLKPGVDTDWLYKLDSESHREACESGGLLKYWFGKTDSANQNLATCKCFLPLCTTHGRTRLTPESFKLNRLLEFSRRCTTGWTWPMA